MFGQLVSLQYIFKQTKHVHKENLVMTFGGNNQISSEHNIFLDKTEM